jgi:hypothetical protein
MGSRSTWPRGRSGMILGDGRDWRAVDGWLRYHCGYGLKQRCLTVRGRSRWLSFCDARQLVRGLGLKSSKEWQREVRSGRIPDEIPSDPCGLYDSEWKGWADWLGSEVENRWRSFSEAREFARGLKLSSTKDWKKWTKTAQRPKDIPTEPFRMYASEWQGWADWLECADRKKVWRPFREAREFARELRLKNYKDWRQWAGSGHRPADIPGEPQVAYKSVWKSMGDWLGTGTISNHKRHFLPFEKARSYARTLGLKGESEWKTWAKSDQRPKNIPAQPANLAAYQSSWGGYKDWLGTGGARIREGQPWRLFTEARAFVRKLGLTSEVEWRRWAKSDQKPKDIPATPDKVYRNKGWQGTSDWLGTKVAQEAA